MLMRIDEKNTTFLNVAKKSIVEVKQHYEAVTNMHKFKQDMISNYMGIMGDGGGGAPEI